MKKKIILIDKLNLITFIISLIYYKRKVVFFTKTKESQEVFFSKCLIVFRKSFKFDVVCYDKNPLYYKKILNATINMTQKNITRLNVDELIYYTCKLNLYYGLFKINEVGVFYKEKYDIEYIFINYVNILKNLDYTNSFQKKIKFYTWFNLKLNDSPESALSSKSLDKRLKDKVKWLLIFIKVAIVAKKTSFDINILYCSDRTYAHNKHNNVFKNLNEEKDAFYNFTTNKIFFKKIEYNLYTLHYKSILNYLFFMIKYYFKYRMFFNKYNTVSLYDQFFLFKNIYFFDRLIKENNIKIVFTIYEALIATIINHITSKSKKTISVSSTWSLRYFSSLETDCNKYSDINFVWGDYQKNIFLKSYDKSKNYIISGYLGDFATEHFKSESKKYVGMNYIVLYDNIFHDDFFITQQQIYEFINITVLFCKKNNLKLVIKTKYEKTFIDYKNLKKIIDDFKDLIILNYTRANLAPVFNAKIVIGISNNTLANIASCLGVPTILYDKFDLLDKQNISKNCFLAKNIHELEDKLNLLYTKPSGYKLDKDSRVDPFVDGKALNRIYEYINELQIYNGTKEEKIDNANFIYQLNYGKDKVIKN